MFPDVNTQDPAAVQAEVSSAYRAMFPRGDHRFVRTAFEWVIACFTGKYPNYQPIDARYHDFEHTLQGTLCLARLLRGYCESGAQPVLNQRMMELGLLAILLHDTGYLKTLDDREGTGAKYTLIHVRRSAEFAARLLGERGFAPAEIAEVQHMIHCTGVNVNLGAIGFQSEIERTVGYALGSSDLLGQMAAPDYIDKLPILYLEFVESAAYNGGKMTASGSFASADDLVRKTPLFWEKYVVPKLQRDFLGVYHYLERPPFAGANDYVERIEANISRLRERTAMAVMA